MLDKIWFIIIILLLYLSINLTIKINFKNLNIKKLVKDIKYKNLLLSLGTKMGVGSIIGITAAICIGGPGTILWIYLFGILSTSIVYYESKLSIKYKNNYHSNTYLIIKNGLNKKKLAYFYIIIFLITYCLLFMMIQTNTLYNNININKIFLIFPLTILYILIIKGINLDKIIYAIMSLITLFFIVLSIYILIKNINILPNIYLNIIKTAFNRKTIVIGIIIGIKRAVFLSELLIGTTEINSFNKDNLDTTNTMILSNYFICIFITFLISSIILIYIYYNGNTEVNYLNLLKKSFSFHFNENGITLLNIIITTLSYSTILSGINIGKKSLQLFNNYNILPAFYLLTFVSLIIAFYINVTLIWKLIDTFMLLLIILNGITIYLLKNNIEE